MNLRVVWGVGTDMKKPTPVKKPHRYEVVFSKSGHLINLFYQLPAAEREAWRSVYYGPVRVIDTKTSEVVLDIKP